MLSGSKVEKILLFFFAFNKVEDYSSIKYEKIDYSDKYFRWTKTSFKHKERLTAFYSESYIKVFETSKVRDRLSGNMSKVKSDSANENFGCLFDIVSDLVLNIPINKLTENQIKEIKDKDKEKEEDNG